MEARSSTRSAQTSAVPEFRHLRRRRWSSPSRETDIAHSPNRVTERSRSSYHRMSYTWPRAYSYLIQPCLDTLGGRPVKRCRSHIASAPFLEGRAFRALLRTSTVNATPCHGREPRCQLPVDRGSEPTAGVPPSTWLGRRPHCRRPSNTPPRTSGYRRRRSARILSVNRPGSAKPEFSGRRK